MATSRLEPMLQHLRRTVLRQERATLTDGQLLEHFIASRDAAAFEILVRRHGPMVLGVCRRILGNLHDAEDAFQACFLVLVRKAASVSPREAVGNWLYGVANTTANRARVANAKRQVRERQVRDMPEPEARPHSGDDLLIQLDRELGRLADKYRVPIVLCDLEGRTRKDVARQLKIPEGTVSSRLTTGRRLLAKRLARHGLPLSGAALAGVLAHDMASACVPAMLVAGTIKAASLLATGQAAATCVASAQVAVLMEGVLKIMLVKKLKAAAVALMLAVCACYGAGAVTREAVGQSELEGKVEAREGRPSLARTRNAPESLEGVWERVSVETGGELLPSCKAVFMVNGNRACWLTEFDEKVDYTNMAGGLYLDPTSHPKAFDLAASKMTYQGIYALEGDTLRLCFDASWEANERPRRFSTQPGSPHFVMVLKRMRGVDVRTYRRPDGSLAWPQLLERRAPVSTSPQAPETIEPAPPFAPPVKEAAHARVRQAKLIEKSIERKLLAPIAPLDFKDVPLKKAIWDLGLSNGVNFYIDNASTDEAGVNLEQRLSLKVENISLESALNLLLADAKLIYIVKDGILQITTKTGVFKQRLHHEVYELRELVEQMEHRLSDDADKKKKVRQQTEELRDGLRQLEKYLQDPENKSGLADVGPNKVLTVAEFYRQSGHPGSACFYYELLCRRYPASASAATANQRLKELTHAP